MTQYLLSVHSGPDDYARPLEEMQPAFEAVDRFNQKARDAGVWVFAGGLQPGDTATVVDGTGAEPIRTDGPYLEMAQRFGAKWILPKPFTSVQFIETIRAATGEQPAA